MQNETRTARRKARNTSEAAKAETKTAQAAKVRSQTRKAAKADNAGATPKRAKAPAKPRKPRKAVVSRVNRGGGAALKDFGNDWVIRVLPGKKSEMNAERADCFRTGRTVAQCLTAMKNAGLRGRRKYIRLQKASGRIELNPPKPKAPRKPRAAKVTETQS